MSYRPHLTPPEASDYLRSKYGIRLAVRTMAKLRSISSTGPVFVRANRKILYPQDCLDAYASKTVSAPMRSTSDQPTGAGDPRNQAIAA